MEEAGNQVIETVAATISLLLVAGLTTLPHLTYSR